MVVSFMKAKEAKGGIQKQLQGLRNPQRMQARLQ